MSDYDCVVGDVDKIYITTGTDKPVKAVFEGNVSIVHHGNGVCTIYKKEKLNIYTSDTTAQRQCLFDRRRGSRASQVREKVGRRQEFFF